MRSAIPEFNKKICPLTKFLETIYKKLGKRTRKSCTKANLLEFGWHIKRANYFKEMKMEL